MNYFYGKIKNINYFKYGMMSPLNLEILYLVIRTTKPNIVVETESVPVHLHFSS
jgi:hypothetical protein